ncbi:MAG TPA: ribbon-helix-helix domain-containing protein [Propionibacteriaceae bacterium]|nr:ribbon-helix-helix domain-containing protein [Propionibacteriaceae bacterium]
MKISVSLPRADVEFLDDYASQHGIETRSGALQLAVDRLRHEELGDAYEQAWVDWDASGDAAAWEGVVSDGLRGA